jgi:hypothetical protein
MEAVGNAIGRVLGGGQWMARLMPRLYSSVSEVATLRNSLGEYLGPLMQTWLMGVNHVGTQTSS